MDEEILVRLECRKCGVSVDTNNRVIQMAKTFNTMLFKRGNKNMLQKNEIVECLECYRKTRI